MSGQPVSPIRQTPAVLAGPLWLSTQPAGTLGPAGDCIGARGPLVSLAAPERVPRSDRRGR